jgi:hypothetical protein
MGDYMRMWSFIGGYVCCVVLMMAVDLAGRDV